MAFCARRVTTPQIVQTNSMDDDDDDEGLAQPARLTPLQMAPASSRAIRVGLPDTVPSIMPGDTQPPVYPVDKPPLSQQRRVDVFDWQTEMARRRDALSKSPTYQLAECIAGALGHATGDSVLEPAVSWPAPSNQEEGERRAALAYQTPESTGVIRFNAACRMAIDQTYADLKARSVGGCGYGPVIQSKVRVPELDELVGDPQRRVRFAQAVACTMRINDMGKTYHPQIAYVWALKEKNAALDALATLLKKR